MFGFEKDEERSVRLLGIEGPKAEILLGFFNHFANSVVLKFITGRLGTSAAVRPNRRVLR
jgi:hypothetical protein